MSELQEAFSVILTFLMRVDARLNRVKAGARPRRASLSSIGSVSLPSLEDLLTREPCFRPPFEHISGGSALPRSEPRDEPFGSAVPDELPTFSACTSPLSMPLSISSLGLDCSAAPLLGCARSPSFLSPSCALSLAALRSSGVTLPSSPLLNKATSSGITLPSSSSLGEPTSSGFTLPSSPLISSVPSCESREVRFHRERKAELCHCHRHAAGRNPFSARGPSFAAARGHKRTSSNAELEDDLDYLLDWPKRRCA